MSDPNGCQHDGVEGVTLTYSVSIQRLGVPVFTEICQCGKCGAELSRSEITDTEEIERVARVINAATAEKKRGS